jgi:hypothetical protein
MYPGQSIFWLIRAPTPIESTVSSANGTNQVGHFAMSRNVAVGLKSTPNKRPNELICCGGWSGTAVVVVAI